LEDGMNSEAMNEDAYLAELKRKATVSMDMLDKARRQSQVYQDYYDGHQWTSEEKRILETRNQPALTFNHVKPAVNAIIGIVERGRTDPKALGRTPQDQDSAEVATDGLRFVADYSRFNVKRRDALKDFLVWGYCAAVQEVQDEDTVTLKRIRPEEFFYDPYSRDGDFGDARYMGIAKWMDESDLQDIYPERVSQISLTFDVAPGGDTFRDRPRDGWAWVDSRARRLMVFEMYKRKSGAWEKCVFVAGGILETGPSPFVDVRGRPRNPIIAQSAYVDMENMRYGVIKDMLGPQDAINKARSKAVHILNVAKLRVDPGLIDIDNARREWAKPDGVIEAREGQIEELGDRNLAPGHLELLRDAKDEMRRQSPTPGIVGRGGASQSGRAILAEQQAGLTEQAPLLAQFDDWTLRCYRGFWECIRQFWNAPKWIRVTDDEEAPRFVGLNVPMPAMDPMTGQPQIDPMTGQPAMQVQNSPAEMDVDIVIDSTPDTAVIQEEQFQRLAELAQAGMPIPPDVLIEASSLPKKKLLLDKLRQAQESQAQAPDAAMQAEMQKAQLQAQMESQKLELQAQAEARKLEMQAQAKAMDYERADQVDERKSQRAMQLADLQFKYDVERMRLEAEAEQGKAIQSVEIKRAEKQAEFDFSVQSKQMDFEYAEAERERDNTRVNNVVQMNKTLDVLGRAIKGMAAPKRLVKDARTGEKRIEVEADDMSLEEAIKRMAAPRRMVRDPMTGEKRIEVVMTEMSVDDAIKALSAPRRVVRDPITGEKRTEILQ